MKTVKYWEKLLINAFQPMVGVGVEIHIRLIVVVVILIMELHITALFLVISGMEWMMIFDHTCPSTIFVGATDVNFVGALYFSAPTRSALGQEGFSEKRVGLDAGAMIINFTLMHNKNIMFY
ncbi:hypothetical protein ACJX0J_021984 [Zea mays]